MTKTLRKVVFGVIAIAVVIFLARIIGLEAGHFFAAQNKLKQRKHVTSAILKSMNPLAIGDTIPNHLLEDMNYNELWLKNLLHPRTAITFFYPKCGPCEDEFDIIASSFPDSAEQQYFVFISPGNPRHTQDLIRELEITAPILYDHNREFANCFGVHTYPFSLVVNEIGQVKEIIAGKMDETDFRKILDFNKAVARAGPQ